MLRCSLVHPSASPEDAPRIERGGVELLDRWQRNGGDLWLDIEGELGDGERALIESFGVSELSITDAMRRRHPPKIETFQGYSFVLFRGIASIGEDLDLAPQQLALFIGDHWLVTAHNGPAVSVNQTWAQLDVLWPGDIGRLTLGILHMIAGRYLDAVLTFEDRLGDLESELLEAQAEHAMRDLASVRSRLRVLRRVFSYHERVSTAILQGISRELGSGAEHGHEHYHERRDLYDRCERLLSLCGMYYEICGDLIESYISISSHQLNRTMKVLTIITAVFVPLSFLAGLYGMNFDYIPELGFRYAYFVLLGVMATLVVAMLVVFRRIRWL